LKVVAHPDPFVLEGELLDRVASAQADDPLAPVLIVVPTRRLAEHVQRRLAEKAGARLGVHVLPYRGLVLRILGEPDAPPLHAWSQRLAETLLASVLEALPRNPWSAFVERRPGALGGLLGTLGDLRDAGVTPEEAGEVLVRGESERAIAELYRAWHSRLASKSESGFTDEAGLVLAAIPGVRAFLSRCGFRTVLHHGAYELIGVHLDLVRELDREIEVTFLLPAEPGAPSGRYAERFARRFLLGDGESLSRLDDREGGVLGDRLHALYDDNSHPRELDAGKVDFENAQGAFAEIRLATRHALRHVGNGTRAEGLAVLARGLSGYALAVDSLTRGEGLKISTTAQAPLRRDPVVHDLLVILRTVSEDFPRDATVEVLRSTRIRWEKIGAAVPRRERAEPWSREAKLLTGLEGWTVDLPEWAKQVRIADDADDEERAEREEHSRARETWARTMGRCLEKLRSQIAEDRGESWAEHAERLERLVREVLTDPDAEPTTAVRRLLGLIDDMRHLDELLDRDSRVSLGEVLEWLEHAVTATEIPFEQSDPGGIRILDVMQARGMTFERVWLIGMNERVFPRVSREDPFLKDDARSRLVEATGRPLPLKDQGADEEHLLLSIALGSAREAVTVSWQRADDEGKSKTASLALREIARLVHGKPDLDRILETARRVPAHPEAWLKSVAEDPGLLSENEETVLLALRSASPEIAGAALASRGAGLERGLRMLSVTESFVPGSMDYDGRIGRGAWSRERYGTTSLETLGHCPLKYFFREVLKVPELEEAASLFSIEARELGSNVHLALEILYRTLVDEGLFEQPDAETLRSRALELVPEAWDEATRSIDRRLVRHLPLFWGWYRAKWVAVLEAFVTEDLDRLVDGGWTVDRLERPAVETLDFGEGVTAPISGKFDRVLEGGAGTLVGDFKSSGDLGKKVKVTGMLKGRKLQVPLYSMMLGGAAVELLGVGPCYYPVHEDSNDRRVEFTGFQNDEQRRGFLETVRVLLALIERGSYPLNGGNHCKWCAYSQACRRNHPPTVWREGHSRDADDYRDVGKKSARDARLLSQVRGGP
jgi:ATP-dependent helicase/nuclease subunit B